MIDKQPPEGSLTPKITPKVPTEGDVVFFKHAKKELGPTGTFVEFKGHGFGVFLGHIPQDAPAPPLIYLFRKFSQMGFIKFDDIAEFLSPEQAKECVEACERKYFGKISVEEAQAMPPAPAVVTDESTKVARRGIGLLGPNGKPLA